MDRNDQTCHRLLTSATLQPDLRSAALHVASWGSSAYYVKTVNLGEFDGREFTDIPPFTDAFECEYPIYVNNAHAPGCRTFLKFHAVYCPVKIIVPENVNSFQLKCYILPSETKTVLRRSGVVYDGVYYLDGMARTL